MAAKRKPTVPANDVSKSDSIRAWFAAHPNGTATECQKALAAEGMTVSVGHVGQIKTKLTGGSSTKVDVETVKKAAAFVKSNGDVKGALKAIETVGAFITECGSPAKAKAALEAFQSLSAVLG